MPYFLGIDVSTRVMGAALFSPTGELLYVDYATFSKRKSPLERLGEQTDIFCTVHEEVGRDELVVFVEEPLKAFAGRSSAQTLQSLAIFNGMTQVNIKCQLDPSDIQLVNPSTARKMAGIKITRNGTSAKEQAFAQVRELYGDDWIVFKDGHSYKHRNDRNEEAPRVASVSYDMADAIVVGLAGFRISTN